MYPIGTPGPELCHIWGAYLRNGAQCDNLVVNVSEGIYKPVE